MPGTKAIDRFKFLTKHAAQTLKSPITVSKISRTSSSFQLPDSLLVLTPPFTDSRAKMPSKPRNIPSSFGCSNASNQCFSKTSTLKSGETSKKHCGKHYWICKSCAVPFLTKCDQSCKICVKASAAKEKREKEAKWEVLCGASPSNEPCRSISIVVWSQKLRQLPPEGSNRRQWSCQLAISQSFGRALAYSYRGGRKLYLGPDRDHLKNITGSDLWQRRKDPSSRLPLQNKSP